MTRWFRRTIALVAATAAVLGSLGGCSEIGVAFDCDELCRTLETCVDSSLSVGRCAERCRDDVDDDPGLEGDLDACTDCLDRDYACSEIPERCPVCASLSERLTGISTTPPVDAGAAEAGDARLPQDAGEAGRD